MHELSGAVAALASREDCPAGPAPVFVPREIATPLPSHTCDVCTCQVTRCSGGPCCF